MRLQKYLSEIGFCSRSQAENFIKAGKILVNGKAAKLGDKVSGSEAITVDGQRLPERVAPKKKVVVFYKPQGVECTLSAMGGVKTLLDFDFGPDRVFPIGRMDRAAQGLLLLTNDGELGNTLAHPSRQHEEEYLVTVEEPLDAEKIAAFANGTLLDEVKIAPHHVAQHDTSVLRCILHEGRIRHIRKICEAIGLTITDARRIRVGAITLGDLEPGSWRLLTDQELRGLRQGGMVRPAERRVVAARRK